MAQMAGRGGSRRRWWWGSCPREANYCLLFLLLLTAPLLVSAQEVNGSSTTLAPPHKDPHAHNQTHGLDQGASNSTQDLIDPQQNDNKTTDTHEDPLTDPKNDNNTTDPLTDSKQDNLTDPHADVIIDSKPEGVADPSNDELMDHHNVSTDPQANDLIDPHHQNVSDPQDFNIDPHPKDLIHPHLVNMDPHNDHPNDPHSNILTDPPHDFQNDPTHRQNDPHDQLQSDLHHDILTDPPHDFQNDPSHHLNDPHDQLHDDPLHERPIPRPEKVDRDHPHRPGSVSLVIHKCCPEEQVYDHATDRCQTSRDLTFSVPIFTVDYYGVYMESNLTRDQVALWSDMLGCQKYLLDVVPEKKPEFDFRVLDTGQLWVPEYEHAYDPPHYCLDNFVRDAAVRGSPHILGAMVCILETQVETFDPTKIPVRKCCMNNEVYDTTESCALRENVTSDPWLVPLRSKQAPPSAGVHLVDIRQPPYSHTHELVPNFQTCVGEQMGWQVEDFHVEEETGGLYVPFLDRVIPDNQYCIEDFHTNGSLVSMAYVCVSEVEMRQLQRLQSPGCQQTESCVAKCCPLGELLDAASGRCVPAGDEYLFAPKLRLDNGSYYTLEDADYQFGFPECEVQLTYGNEGAELLERGGALRYLTNNTDECQPQQAYSIPRGHYCIDQVYYPSGEVKQGAGFCFKENWEHITLDGVEKQGVNYLYSAFLAISDLFILVSFVVYLTVPDQNKRGLNKNVKLAHSVLGRILLCFLFSLFFAYLFLIIIKLFSDPINLASPNACIALGVCMYTFFMATFFWLNVLCFELWWKCARQERSSGRRWVWYQVYAWTCPAFFAGVSLVMEFAPNISNCYIKPKFGTYSCFFSYSVSHNNGAKWAYFLGPVAVLLLADLVFFLLTVRSLLVTVQQSHKGTVQRQGRQRLKLCFKLFLVMGISWLAEIISFQLGPSTVWYISDVFNCFQGFIIFLIFILKPKILEAMRTRVCSWCGSPPPARPRGTNVFGSVMISNSASTDEFSLSNQLSFAHSHLTPSRSHSPASLARFQQQHHKDLVLSVSNSQLDGRQSPASLARFQQHHNLAMSLSNSQLDCRSSNGLSKRTRPPGDFGPTPPLSDSAPSSSPSSSRPSTPRTTSTRASLSALSVEEAAC